MKQSAGILLFRQRERTLEFLLVHPGGPFFAHKDAGWWTVPKGEPLPGEALLAAAVREFGEETGVRPDGRFTELQPVQQKGGKKVHCWAVAGDLDPEELACNTFELEWPPRSGRRQSFPEVDRAGWFAYEDACRLINERQRAFLDEVMSLHRSGSL